ncbi:hypothetical protein ISCGN_027197 [Ixodes scapularis]
MTVVFNYSHCVGSSDEIQMAKNLQGSLGQVLIADTLQGPAGDQPCSRTLCRVLLQSTTSCRVPATQSFVTSLSSLFHLPSPAALFRLSPRIDYYNASTTHRWSTMTAMRLTAAVHREAKYTTCQRQVLGIVSPYRSRCECAQKTIIYETFLAYSNDGF